MPHGRFHPSTRTFRFSILFFISLLTFGSYFAYDIIGAVAPTLVEELGAQRSTVGSMYSIYSIAAVLSVFIGGFMIDRLGTRKSSMIFSVLVLLGAAGVALARSLPILFIGRFIFGAGSEPLIVAQSAIIARWFKNKEIAYILQVSLDTVKIRLHRARAMLKKELDDGCTFYHTEQDILACDRKQSHILPKIPE